MKKYKKTITLHYRYVQSIEGEESLAKVFDDIFKRIIKKKKDNPIQNPGNILTNI